MSPAHTQLTRVLAACGIAFLLVAGAIADSPPSRIVSLSPNLTETIFALGAGGRLVGVSDFCKWPPKADSIRNVGGWTNPNFEVLTALQPDLIVLLGRHEKVFDFARARNIPVAQISMDSLETIRSGTLRLGQILGCDDAATSLTAAFDASLARFDARRRARPAKPLRVYLSLTRKPKSLGDLFTTNGKTFLDEALALAGGENIFNDIELRYPQISKESLVARQPDIILEIEAGIALKPADIEQLARDWDGFAIPAVRNGRIHVLTEDYLLIAGPRFPQIVETLANALYPEIPPVRPR